MPQTRFVGSSSLAIRKLTFTAVVVWWVMMLMATVSNANVFVPQDGMSYQKELHHIDFKPQDCNRVIMRQHKNKFPFTLQATGNFIGAAFDGTNVWPAPCEAGNAIRINKDTFDMNIIAWPAGVTPGGCASKGTVFDGSHVWYVSFNLDRIVRVNTLTYSMESFALPPNILDSGLSTAYAKYAGGVYLPTSQIVFVPMTANGVLVISASDGTATSYPHLPSGVSSNTIDKWHGGVYDGQYVWMCPHGTNILGRFDVANPTATMAGYNNYPAGMTTTGAGFNPFFTILHTRSSRVWLVPAHADRLILFNGVSLTMTGYNSWPSGFTKTNSWSFMGATYDGKYIWLAPHTASMLIRVEEATGSMTGFSSWPSNYTKSVDKFSTAVNLGTSILLLPWDRGNSVVLTIQCETSTPTATYTDTETETETDSLTITKGTHSSSKTPLPTLTHAMSPSSSLSETLPSGTAPWPTSSKTLTRTNRATPTHPETESHPISSTRTKAITETTITKPFTVTLSESKPTVCPGQQTVESECTKCNINWYHAPRCDVFCDPLVSCSGHGSCNASATTPTSSNLCICVAGWCSDDCSISAPVPTLPAPVICTTLYSTMVSTAPRAQFDDAWTSFTAEFGMPIVSRAASGENTSLAVSYPRAFACETMFLPAQIGTGSGCVWTSPGKAVVTPTSFVAVGEVLSFQSYLSLRPDVAMTSECENYAVRLATPYVSVAASLSRNPRAVIEMSDANQFVCVGTVRTNISMVPAAGTVLDTSTSDLSSPRTSGTFNVSCNSVPASSGYTAAVTLMGSRIEAHLAHQLAVASSPSSRFTLPATVLVPWITLDATATSTAIGASAAACTITFTLKDLYTNKTSTTNATLNLRWVTAATTSIPTLFPLLERADTPQSVNTAVGAELRLGSKLVAREVPPGSTCDLLGLKDVSTVPGTRFRWSPSASADLDAARWAELNVSMSQLSIPPRVLFPGRNYTFKSEAVLDANTTRVVYVDVAATRSANAVGLFARNLTMVFTKSFGSIAVPGPALTVDVVDPDIVQSTKTAGVSTDFTWECANLTNPCPDAVAYTTRTYGGRTTVPTWTLPNLPYSQLSSNGITTFELRVTYMGTSHGHAATANTTVFVRLIDAAILGAGVSQTALGLYISRSAPNPLIPTQRTVLTAEVMPTSEQNSVSYNWQCSGLNVSNSVIAPFGSTSRDLVLASSVLEPYVEYSCRVIVMRPQPPGRNMSSLVQGVDYISSAVPLEVARPPTGGTLSFTRSNTSEPFSGMIEELAVVTITAPHWVAASPHNEPLAYEFSVVGEGGQSLVLAPFQSSSILPSVRLPSLRDALGEASASTPEAVVSIAVRVRDAVGSVASASEAVLLTSMSLFLKPGDPALLKALDGAISDAEASLSILVANQDAGASLQGLRELASLVAVRSESSNTSDTTNSSTSSVSDSMLESTLSVLELPRDVDSTASVAMHSLSTMTGAASSTQLVSRVDGVLNVMQTFTSTLNNADPTSGTETTATAMMDTLAAVGKSLSSASVKKTGRRRTAQKDQEDYVRRTVDVGTQVSDGLMSSVVPTESRTVVGASGMAVSCVRPAEGESSGSLPANSAASLRPVQVLDGSGSGKAGGASLCQTSWPTNIFARSTDSYQSANASSATMSITFRPIGSSATPSTTPINVTFTLRRSRGAPIPGQGASDQCVFYNFTIGAFSYDGCTSTPTYDPDVIMCHCTHLTDFGLMVSPDDLLNARPKVYIDIGNFEDIKVGGIIYVCSLLGLVLIGVAIGFYIDQRRQREIINDLYNAHVALSEHLAASKNLTVTDNAFPRSAYDCHEMPRIKQETSAKTSVFAFYSITSIALSFHPWLAPFLASATSPFTVPQRMWLLGNLTICAFFFNGLFYVSDTANTGEMLANTILALIAVSVCSPLIVVTVTFFFVRTGRTRLDVRHWYVPPEYKDSALAKALFASVDETTQEILTNRCLGTPQTTQLTFDIAQLRAIASRFLENEQGLLYLSTEIKCLFFYRKGSPLAPQKAPEPGDGDDMNGLSIVTAANDTAQLAGNQRPPSPTNAWGSGLNPEVEPTIVAEEAASEHAIKIKRNIMSLLREGCTDSEAADNKVTRPVSVLHVLHQWTRKDVDWQDPFFISCEEEAPALRDMWSTSTQRAVWRLGIESVKNKDYVLAECLFGLALLLENPDMYYVIFGDSSSTAATTDQVLLRLTKASLRLHFVSYVPIAWAQFYAAVYYGVKPPDYMKTKRANIERGTAKNVSPVYLKMLLGINNSDRPFYSSYGCVPYCILEEKELAVPKKITSPEEFTALLEGSPVVASHVLRLSIARANSAMFEHRRNEEEAHAHATTTAETDSSIVVDTRTLWTEGIESMSVPKEAARRYSPYAAADAPELDFPTFFPKALRERLSVGEDCHTVLEGTIEFARYHASLIARETLGWTYDQFAEKYSAEEEAILEVSSERLGIARHETEGWAGATDCGKLKVKRTPTGNNLLPPTLVSCGKSLSGTNDYLTYLINFHVSGNVSARFICSRASGEEGLTVLSSFHPARHHGTGSVTCPFLSWSTLEARARMGDTVYMFGGVYAPFSLSNLRCPAPKPLLICPVDGRLAEQRMALFEKSPHFVPPKKSKASGGAKKKSSTSEAPPELDVSRMSIPGQVDRCATPPTVPEPGGAPPPLTTTEAAQEGGVPDGNAVMQVENNPDPDTTQTDEAAQKKQHDPDEVTAAPNDKSSAFAEGTAGTEEADGGDEIESVASSTRTDPNRFTNFVRVVECEKEGRKARRGEGAAALIRLDGCSHVHLSGMELVAEEEAIVGVNAIDCDDVILEDCVIHAPVAASADGGMKPVPLDRNTHYPKGRAFINKLRTLTFPVSFIAMGYVLSVAVFVLFALGSLFVTSAMTQSEADAWVSQSAISICIKVVIVTPIMCVLRTGLYLVMAVNALNNAEDNLDFDLSSGDGAGTDFDF
eukprot:PhM_4_TR8798/c0_g1_i1/m.102247